MIAITPIKRAILDHYAANPTHATALKQSFLQALRETGIVLRACERTGIDRPTVYLWRQEDAEFAAAWTDALEDAVDVVEESLYSMATSRKNVVATIFYLKNNREKYREETRIIVSKEDVDSAIEAALAEHQLPGVEPLTLEAATTTDTNNDMDQRPDQPATLTNELP